VRTTPAERVAWPRTIATVGSLHPSESTTIAAEVSGRLIELAADVGSRVQAGDVLARLDGTGYDLRVRQAEAALEQTRALLGLAPGQPDDAASEETAGFVQQAKARLTEAKTTLDRLTPLREEGVVSQAAYDAVRSAHDVAVAAYEGAHQDFASRRAQLAQRRAELGIAREELADTELRAPYAGAVVERRAAVGDFLTVGRPVFTFITVDRLRLAAAVPERDAPLVREGARLWVREDDGAPPRETVVSRVSPSLRATDRTLRIEADLEVGEDPERAPRAGSFVRVEIVVDAEASSVVVPAACVASFAGIDRVFTVEGGAAVELRVESGRSRGDRIEVLSGLEAGTAVVLDPGPLRHGERVRVIGAADR